MGGQSKSSLPQRIWFRNGISEHKCEVKKYSLLGVFFLIFSPKYSSWNLFPMFNPTPKRSGSFIFVQSPRSVVLTLTLCDFCLKRGRTSRNLCFFFELLTSL